MVSTTELYGVPFIATIEFYGVRAGSTTELYGVMVGTTTGLYGVISALPELPVHLEIFRAYFPSAQADAWIFTHLKEIPNSYGLPQFVLVSVLLHAGDNTSLKRQ